MPKLRQQVADQVAQSSAKQGGCLARLPCIIGEGLHNNKLSRPVTTDGWLNHAVCLVKMLPIDEMHRYYRVMGGRIVQQEYISRLRKSACFVCIALVLTWGLVIYLMWLTNQQEHQINELTAQLNASSNSSDSEDAEPKSAENSITIWI